MAKYRKCWECIDIEKTEHHVTRVEDYREGRYGNLWAFYECAAGHVTAYFVALQEYERLKAELRQGVLL